MPGTKTGARRAAATIKEKYGQDYYARIGARGGSLGRTGGFYANRELARSAGALGGQRSKRPPSNKTHCIHGHSLADAYVTKDKRRHCRECQRLRYIARK